MPMKTSNYFKAIHIIGLILPMFVFCGNSNAQVVWSKTSNLDDTKVQANLGNADAKNQLGNQHNHNQVYEKAFKWWSKAAKHKDEKAIIIMGM